MPPRNRIVTFADQACTELEVAGGKGANLARMTAAGLPVPPGFVVRTEAYSEFVKAAGLGGLIDYTVAFADAAEGDADLLEAATAALRTEIVESPLPAPLARAIGDAYTAMAGSAGADEARRVAVRSSGTAEDLAGASFAGLRDTYLDVCGADAVLDAVRRCWASMWTARATAYRAARGFDQARAKIAVVVQQMVAADISGVMFTANPLTAATDELVINSTWGLGEALVSGIATPDEHVMALKDLSVRSERRGSKEKRVVRDPGGPSGTIAEDGTPASLRERIALTRSQLRALGELGRQVMAFNDGIPQDTEWALVGNELYLLQSRPATGADFAWEEDLESWQEHQDDGSILWSRSWSDEVWNGAISPFAYSYRGWMFTQSINENLALWGRPPLSEPAYRYHGATAYYNTAVEERLVTETAPVPFRAGLLAHVAPDRHEQVLSAPLLRRRYLEMHARILTLGKPIHGALRYFKTVDNYIVNRQAEADGLSAEQLRLLGDEQLIGYLERIAELKKCNTSDQWTEFFIMARDSFSLLAGVIASWYDPEPMLVITDLMSGSPVRTETAEENLELWRLSQRIRRSPELRALFEEHGVGYLEAFSRTDEGRKFVADYQRFLAAHAHGGHADRDIYHPRRADDPTIDHQTFATLLAAETPVEPRDRERSVNARRNAVVASIEARLRAQRFGAARVKAFRTLFNYVHRFFLYRDNQRHYFDRYTYSMKRGVVDAGRRLVERGVLRDVDDAYFFGRSELYALLRGSESMTPKMRAKLAGRRANFMRQMSHTAQNPKYMRGGRPVVFDTGESTGGAGLKGVGTSRGQVTGRARVILSLKEIGKVHDGEILITHSTDPGWTPVFTLLSGIVLETGGMLAHGSLLAREYGFPAVQVADATQLIPDGAEITVDGDTGTVVIVSSD